MGYDSRPDTWAHIHRVQELVLDAAKRLIDRAHQHDQTKLHEPERSAFDEATPKLRGSTYGSDEYRATLRQIKPAIAHHNAHNSHHPEHYDDGIAGMDLLDLLEMVCDWKAASERHDDGDLRASFRINKDRFGIEPQLLAVLKNTARRLGLMGEED